MIVLKNIRINTYRYERKIKVVMSKRYNKFKMSAPNSNENGFRRQSISNALDVETEEVRRDKNAGRRYRKNTLGKSNKERYWFD